LEGGYLKKVIIILGIIFAYTFLLCGSASAVTSLTSSSQPSLDQGTGNIPSHHDGTYNAPTKLYISKPQVKYVDPGNNSVNVPLNKVIKLTFNKPIKLGTKPWIEFKNTRWGLKPFTVSTTGNVLSIKPKFILAYGTLYNVIIHSKSIEDLTGNGMASPYAFKFKTGNTLKVTSTSPANKALNIAITKLIRITFNRPIKNPINSLIQFKSTSGTLIPITFSISQNSLFIYHSPLKKNTQYIITLKPNCIKDISGNNFLLTYTNKFTTGNSYSEYNFPSVYLPARLIIPKLGVKCFIRSDTVNAYNAVYHYPNSVYPGNSGECGLMAHRTTYSKLFRYINLLKVGDLVTILDYNYDLKYSYRVISNGHDIRWDYRSNPITFKNWGQCLLLLVSCHPPGTSNAAWITHCKLVSTLPIY
jgi:sortase A